jgi:hypothetical protein
VVQQAISGGRTVPKDCPAFILNLLKKPPLQRKPFPEPVRWVDDLFKDFGYRKDTAVIVGSGPSVRHVDLSLFNSKKVCTFCINDEVVRARGKYHPNFWVFNDPMVLDKYRMLEVDIKTSIVCSHLSVQQAFGSLNWPQRPLPDWIWRVYQYKGTQKWKETYQNHLFVRRTTATVCLMLAMRMGFSKIALVGVDMYQDDNGYYYDGSGGKPTTKANPLGGGIYFHTKHARMLADLKSIRSRIDELGWPGEVYQTSMDSPVDFFTKKPLEEVLR